jgi:hypothetical protein
MCAPVNGAQILQVDADANLNFLLDVLMQKVMNLLTRLATPAHNRDFLNKNFDLWEALFAELRRVPPLTGLAECKAEEIPPVKVLEVWERELRERIQTLRLRSLTMSMPALVSVGIDIQAAQRIPDFM